MVIKKRLITSRGLRLPSLLTLDGYDVLCRRRPAKFVTHVSTGRREGTNLGGVFFATPSVVDRRGGILVK